jgi:hypothetical protein
MNTNHETLGLDYICAIHEALKEDFRDLQHHLRTMARGQNIENFLPARGSSIFAKLPVQLRAIDADAILKALQDVERKYGWNKAFAGRQVNLLMSTWRRHVERLQEAERNQQDNSGEKISQITQ